MAKKPRLLGSRAGATQTRMLFALDATLTNKMIDVAQCLSLVNHRLYKQNRNYVVRVGWGGTLDSSAPAAAPIDVQAAQNTWQLRKAHAYAQQTYWRVMRTVAHEANLKFGRWHQFIVDQLFTTEGLSRITPWMISSTGSEWTVSELANTGGAGDYRWSLIGNTSGFEFGLLKSYDLTADTEEDTPPGTGAMPYAAVDLHGLHSENADEVVGDADSPPYNPTALQHQPQFFTCGAGTATSPNHPIMTPWFTAPCGLLRITPNGSWENNFLVVEVAAGPYKGTLSEAM